MRDCAKDEVAALVDRFMALGAHWCLDNVQVTALLGIDAELDVFFDEADLLWAIARSGCDAERRMRLLVEVDGLLVRLVPDPRAVAGWLRSPSVGYENELVTPMVALSSGAPAIRALRNLLEQMPDQGRLAA